MFRNISKMNGLTFTLIALIFLITIMAFWPLLDVVILAFSLAVVVMPLHRRFSRGISENISAGITTSIIFAVCFGALFFTISILYENSAYLSEILTTIFAWVQSIQFEQLGLPFSAGEVEIWINDEIGLLTQSISSGILGIPMIVVKILVFFLSLYMFILKGDLIWRELSRNLPQKIREAMDRLSLTTVNTLYAIYIVHISTAVLTFILAIPFFYFLGYDHILFYCLIAAIFQLIPIIGPTVLMLFLGTYALSIGDFRALALLALIGYPVVCAFPDLYLRPVMMGKRASIHPVIMWIGFFGGLAVMGIIGFIIGPLILALMISAYAILIEELKKSGAETSG